LAAYLFRVCPPSCAEPACHNPGVYSVRSDLFFWPGQLTRYGEIPKPRCLRHAKRLKTELEADEVEASRLSASDNE
jgi:hypothetical protein